jgi:hypothetical protein
MAVLTVGQPVLGTPVTHAPVSANGGGDSFPNDGYTVFYVKNGGGAPITVTFDSPGFTAPSGSLAVDADYQVTVAAGAEKWIGPFTDKQRFNDANGRVAVAYSGVTSVTVQALRAG